MFNAEQLLGKMVAEMVGSGRGHKRHKGGMVSSLASTLLSGQGLMTAIGLGVGAYEILQQSKQGATPPPLSSPPPPLPNQGSVAMPSPSIAAVSTPPPLSGASSNPLQDRSVPPVQEGNLAMRLIQAMIAAAHADGSMDSEEEGQILARLQGQGLTQEERSFVLMEMHDPKPIEQLVVGVNDPRVAQTMYSLAVSAITVDSAAERAWLDQLAAALSISDGMRRFIEAEDEKP